MHAGMSSGLAHQASASFLTGVPGAGRPGFRNAISLDQLAAEHIGMADTFSQPRALGGRLRWPFLDPHRSSHPGGQLAVEGLRPTLPRRRGDEVRAQLQRLDDGRSILDDVRSQARCPQCLGTRIATSSTNTSPACANWKQRMVNDERWARTPKPKVDAEPPH
jgi:hypothetical protein